MSSDLSHFYDEATANRLDTRCNQAVTDLDLAGMERCEACGNIGMKAAIYYAKGHHLSSELLDYRTSAQATGDTSRVVGYGSYLFYPDETNAVKETV